ncbi:hypothetical protein [Nostoc sp.]
MGLKIPVRQYFDTLSGGSAGIRGVIRSGETQFLGGFQALVSGE